MTVTVTDVNEPPIVDPATFSVTEAAANGDPVGTVTFSDPDAGQTGSFSIESGNSTGIFAIGAASGQVTVADHTQLNAGDTPVYSLTVRVTDNGSPVLYGEATITINVTPPNRTPVVDTANFDVPEGSANGTVVGTVTSTESGRRPDVDLLHRGGQHRRSIRDRSQLRSPVRPPHRARSTSPTHPSASPSGRPTTGPRSCSARRPSRSRSRAPIDRPPRSTTRPPSPRTRVPQPVDVLGNDTDSDGGAKSITAVTQSPNGTVAITGGGTGLTYTPNGGFCNNPPGTNDDFTYTLNGGSSATVHMTVDCLSVAVDDGYAVIIDTQLSVGAGPGVLNNDTVHGGTIASYGASTGAEQTTIGTATPTAQGGSVALDADGSFDYTPPTGYNGSDTFKYVLHNAGGDSTATVTFTVGPKGDQTITFTSTAPAGAKVGGPTYTVTATATSGLTVTFTIDASAASVCTISALDRVASSAWAPASSTPTRPAMGAGTPRPRCSSRSASPRATRPSPSPRQRPSDATVGGPTYDVTATATSGLTVTFTIDASASSVCSIAGSTVSLHRRGHLCHRRQPGWRCELERRAPGAAVVPGHRSAGHHQRERDQLHLDRARLHVHGDHVRVPDGCIDGPVRDG